MYGRQENAHRSRGDCRPSIAAIPYREASGGKISYLLSEPERIALARIAARVRFSRGALIFRQGDPAEAVYNISSGVVRTSRTAADGSRSILAVLFPDDLFGLAEEGLYVNTAAAVTAVAAWRLPIAALQGLLRGDPMLEWHLLLKLCHELREAQRHALILARHRALTRLALFILMLARSQEARNESESDIYLPMTRSDIADYLGLTLAAVSRSFRTLESRALIAFGDRRHLRIVDRARLQSLGTPDVGTDDPGK
jgi:CRP/FNR family transcriptional regulator, anaerobic regulatory protein